METLVTNSKSCNRTVHTLCPTHQKSITKNYFLACFHGCKASHFSRVLTILQPCTSEHLNTCAWENHITGAIPQCINIVREFAIPNKKQFCSFSVFSICHRHDKLNHFNYVLCCHHPKEETHYNILAYSMVDFAFCNCDSETFILS